MILIYRCTCSVCQASANMVIVTALLNVSQYTRMVSLTPDYVHIMTGTIFIFTGSSRKNATFYIAIT